jgi:hypothetical protein
MFSARFLLSKIELSNSYSAIKGQFMIFLKEFRIYFKMFDNVKNSLKTAVNQQGQAWKLKSFTESFLSKFQDEQNV